MLTLKVNTKEGVFEVKLPNSINEITEDYIKAVTSHIVIEDNYTLIGIVYKEKLSTIVLAASKNNKKTNIPVIPIFVKAGNSNRDIINSLSVKDKLIISPSDIMMGYHISAPNNLLTINNFLDLINEDRDIYKVALTNKEEVYFIEFKLVPNCNIHGAYKNINEPFKNPYVNKIEDARPSSIITPNKPNVII